jgi:xanthine dehydrogenase accessory factor
MDVFEQIATLRREGRPFAVATVVARRAPVSAHLGDRAIVFADGRMEGFVGGACSREIIRQQALDAMKARCGRLVSIRPDAGDSSTSSGEHVVVPMTCASEGAIDVYVEPFVQARRLVVVGATPVAESLARLARGMNYDVVRVVEPHEQRDIEPKAVTLGVKVVTLDALQSVLPEGGPGGADLAAVVASQGHYDEQALESLLRCNVPYVGLVASRQRGATVRALLDANGVPDTTRIRNPAGLDLGARTPAEVALSILAEIVQLGPSGAPAQAKTLPTVSAVAAQPTGAVDPVCGMQVEIATARHTAEMDGHVYYFCCASCRARFLKDPQQYLARTP